MAVPIDATIIDTTALDIDAAVERASQIVSRALAEGR
jgi:hypothetical protein